MTPSRVSSHPPFRPRLLWTLVVRTVRDAHEDRVLGLAAEVAFFTLFSLPPTLLAVFGAAGYVGDALGPNVTDRMVEQTVLASRSLFSSGTVDALVEPTVRTLLTEGRADIFSIGVLFALWSASRSSHVLIDALSIAYDLEARRPVWRRRLLAIAFTFVGLLLAGVVIPLLIAGPRLGAALADPLGLADTFVVAWNILYWPAVGFMSVLALTTFYHFAIPWKTPFHRDIPGALLALLLWFVCAAALRTYADWTIRSSSIYASLAAPMVLLLWLYVSALAVLMGAELNAEIEKMWPTLTAREKQQAERKERRKNAFWPDWVRNLLSVDVDDPPRETVAPENATRSENTIGPENATPPPPERESVAAAQRTALKE